MRVLTWNARGDRPEEHGGSGTAEKKAAELVSVLDYWEQMGDPVVVVCLQELARSQSALRGLLTGRGWTVGTAPENADGGGRAQAIAASPALRVNRFATVRLPVSETIPSSPSRFPYRADLTLGANGRSFTVVTWHATLGTLKMEHIVGLSEYVSGREFSGKGIIVAADFNCHMDILNQSGLFRGFKGFSTGLDHIIAKGITLSDGRNSWGKNSDHSMTSAHFEL